MTEFARPQTPWALRLVPPMPAVTHRILALIGNDETGTRELEKLVTMDPSFSAELLRFANSALFATSGEVKSLSHAIALVGIDNLKTMATLVAVNKMVRSAVRLEALRKVWIHSVVTALIAEEAANLTGESREVAYTVGLLHNLGTLGLMSAYPEEYSRMLAVNDDFGLDLISTERDLFEIDHCLAGSFLARDWDFPKSMAAAIECHHEVPVAGERSLANLVKVSWRLSDVLGYSAFQPDKEWSYEELIAFLPAGSSWLGSSPETAALVLKDRVAALPH